MNHYEVYLFRPQCFFPFSGFGVQLLCFFFLVCVHVHVPCFDCRCFLWVIGTVQIALANFVMQLWILVVRTEIIFHYFPATCVREDVRNFH